MRKIEMVTRDDLEARLKDCLEQHQMPDYFLYLGDSGVTNWLNLAGSAEFPVASRLTDLLRQSLSSIIRHLPTTFDLVSIGVGSGEKERLLLQAVIPQAVRTYYAVDISNQMVDKALDTVANIPVSKIAVVAFLDDLALLQQLWRSPLLLCLLGNNFCNYEPDDLLKTVYEQLEPGDLFLFDCHLLPQREGKKHGRVQVEQVYRSQPNVHFNVDPLVQRGLDPNNYIFHLDLLPVRTSIGTMYRTNKSLHILKDTTISCGPNKVLLVAGDILRLGFTYKYTCSQVEQSLQRHGFHIVELFLSPDNDNLLALVRKRPV